MEKTAKKEVLVGNFVKKNKILSYLEFIHNNYFIKYSNLFVYLVDGNEEEYLVTFKIDTNNRRIIKDINGGCILHYKKGCLFSINALNKLTENDKENENDFIEIDWDKYKDKLILLTNNDVSIKTLTKIIDKNHFFQ